MSRPKTRTCSAHCRSCGRHFSSNAAFDKHRRDFACLYPSEVTVKGGESWFTTVTGDCRIASAVPEIGVTIHQEAAAAARGASIRSAA